MLDPSTLGYARDPKMDRAGLINPGEVGSRSLCALLRIEDALKGVLARLDATTAGPASVLSTEGTVAPLLTEIRDLLAASPKPAPGTPGRR